MQNNRPVTQREFNYDDNATLLSMTNTQSRITYASAAFIQVSTASLKHRAMQLVEAVSVFKQSHKQCQIKLIA